MKDKELWKIFSTALADKKLFCVTDKFIFDAILLDTD